MSRYKILNTNNVYCGDKPIQTPFKWCIYDIDEQDISEYCLTKKQAIQTIKEYEEN